MGLTCSSFLSRRSSFSGIGIFDRLEAMFDAGKPLYVDGVPSCKQQLICED